MRRFPSPLRPRAYLALVLALAESPAVPAAADSPPAVLRVWAGTRLEIRAERRSDEAGAAWREARGRLLSDRGEPIAGATVRFERDGAVVETDTGPDGRFDVLLREAPGGGAPWVARFHGGERLRPTSTVVPGAPPADSGASWIAFAPLLLLGIAGLAALATPLLRRSLARLGAALRRAAATRRRPSRLTAGGSTGR